MPTPLPVLDAIVIDTPCTVPWERMAGDDRVRFCSQCNKHVHDLSELTSSEAVALLTETESLPCMRLYRRPDGRVVTAECALSLRERTWKWLHGRSAWAASLFALVFFAGCGDTQPTCFTGKPSTSSQRRLPTPTSGEERADDAPPMAPSPRPAGVPLSSVPDKATSTTPEEK